MGGSRLLDMMMMMHQVNRLVERSITIRGQVGNSGGVNVLLYRLAK